MIFSILLTMVFGFGVITIATIALLNVAGLRLHDLREVKHSDEFTFEYAYSTKSAYDLRTDVGKLPRRLTSAAVVALLFVTALNALAYALVDAPILGQSTANVGHLTPIAIITWLSITSYVAVLLCVAGSISTRCYAVLKDIENRRSGTG